MLQERPVLPNFNVRDNAEQTREKLDGKSSNQEDDSISLQKPTTMQHLEGDIPMAASSGDLTWINVAIALVLILFDIGVSTVFRLGIGMSLLIAALRCTGQLALVAAVLHRVFETRNPWLVSLVCCVCLVLLFLSGVSDDFFFLSRAEFLGHFRGGYD